jgi:hypothetical protein
MGRTGSSHLNRLLGNCNAFNTKSELFHPRAAARFRPQEIEMLNAASGGLFGDREASKAWMREHPAQALDAIYNGGWKRIVVFKVFSGHLQRDAIVSQLIENPDMRFAILRRRPIESFISRVKTEAVGQFAQVDTTETKPTLSAQDFTSWAPGVQRWYDWVRQTLETRNLPYAKIRFERHLEDTPDREALAQVLDLLRPLGLPNITVPQHVEGRERQDRECRYQNRVANWDAFEGELRGKPRHARLLDWALQAP